VPAPMPNGPGPRPPTGGGVPRLTAGVEHCSCWLSTALAGGAVPLGVVTSALPLFVAQVLTDHHDPAMTPNHFALLAHLLDARVDLHGLLFVTRVVNEH
jgi:hypothetical protein